MKQGETTVTTGTRKNNAARGPKPHPVEPFRSLLIPIDLTPASSHVLQRAARLPLADKARVTLLHVVPTGFSSRDERSAARDAKKALADHAAHLSKVLPKSVTIRRVVKVGAPVREIAECASESKAELIVMGRGGGRTLRDIFLGSTAERVIRRGQLPVLVVRLPANAPYERPALALDLDQPAQHIVTTALRALPAPRPRVTLLHAFDTPYEGIVYPSLSEEDASERRSKLRQEATLRLAGILSRALAQARVPDDDVPQWKVHVRHGSPRLIVERAVKKANTDLLVLGTHGYTGGAHMFLGTVAGDVLRDVPCDVLVVPPV
jgi:nucleotide-binding universal stress UspA family protein